MTRVGLVDEILTIVFPVIVGGGNHFFPSGIRLNLQLTEERRFADGVVALRYDVKN